MSQLHKDERVIITAPVGQDAEAMAAALRSEGFETQICQRLDECSRQMADSAGAVLMTEEALESEQASRFLDVLRTQAPWSELPLIILTSGGESRRAELLDLAAAAAGTVILLERPISTRTLMRSVQVALRSRRRQYQVRDLVRQLASLNQTLEQRVAQRTAEAVERAQRLRLLSAELSLAEERERRRIAQVLHDDLQQMLMAARLYLRTLGKTENAAKRTGIIQRIQNMLERSFNLTRSLSVELSPPVLHDHGLAAALEWLAAQTRKHHGANVSVEADSSANPKAIDVRVFLFQAVRELLLNAVKHAAGSPVHIVMKSVGSDKLHVIVSDRGPGFDPATLDRQGIELGGLGLFSIRERMASFEGKLRIDSAPRRGTRITLIAPRG
jgi:signal transduction histidine kinase